MIVEGYSMDLYCDGPDCNHGRWGQSATADLCGRTRGECIKQAKAGGWKFFFALPQKVLCPQCAKKRKKP